MIQYGTLICEGTKTGSEEMNNWHLAFDETTFSNLKKVSIGYAGNTSGGWKMDVVKDIQHTFEEGYNSGALHTLIQDVTREWNLEQQLAFLKEQGFDDYDVWRYLETPRLR